MMAHDSAHKPGGQPFSKPATWYLVCLTVACGLARILYHYDRPFTGDEVGTLMYIQKSAGFILSHFESWLTMNYFILLEKIMAHLGGQTHASLILVPLIAGIATIPLTAVLARLVASTTVALIAATLVAVNPYLFWYSGNIRSYSMLTALSLLAVILFLVWRRNRTLKNGVLVSLASCVLVLAHPNGAYVVSYVMLIAGIDVLASLRARAKTGAATLLVPLSGCILLLLAAYARLYPAILIWGIPFHDVPPTSISYIPYVAAQYLGEGYSGWLAAALLIYGVLVSIRRNKPLLIIAPCLVIPVVLMSVQGISHYPWAYARFLIFLVPVGIIFVAEGAQSAASHFRREDLVTWVLAGLVIATWIPGAQNLFERKVDYPWSRVADFITTASQRQDVILFKSGVESLNLYPYFSHTGRVQSVVSEYTEEQHDQNMHGNVFLVRGEPFLTSEFPTHTFGKIQVIVYPHATYASQLVMIRDDLIRSIKPGALSPELTEDYGDIWLINRRIGQDDSANFKYFQMYTLCFQLTDRQRNIPISQQYRAAENAAQGILGTP